MKAITREAIDSFNSRKEFYRSNTQVKVTARGAELYLFGNLIASTIDGKLRISNRGWFTATTKERLNALDGVSIVQRKGKWYLNGNEWNGRTIEIV